MAGDAWKACAIILALAFGMTFLPGMPRATFAGVEVGTAQAGLPLQIPITRILQLKRGQAVRVSYQANVRQGVLTLRYRSADVFFNLDAWAHSNSVLTLRGPSKGAVIFKAPKDGYYFFTVGAETGTISKGNCSNILGDFWNAIMSAQSACPTYNSNFLIVLD